MDPTPQEQGFSGPRPLPVPSTGLPPGGHQWAVPHFETFNGLSNIQSRAYQSRFDTAMRASAENAWRMRLDPILDTSLDVRVTPTALLPVSVRPQDEDDQQQIAAAKRQERLLNLMPRRTAYRWWMLKEGLFVGRSGAQIIYSWTRDAGTGRMMVYPSAWVPLNGDKLQFHWDGRAGIRVNSSSSVMGHKNTVPLDNSMVYFPDPQERQGLVVHKAFIEDADFTRPWFAGAIHGTGFRGKLYWAWALKSQLWGMAIDFLRWFSKGLMVYYFEHGNDAHRQAIQDFVSQQDGETAMLYPLFRSRDTKDPYLPKAFEHIPVSQASPQFLQTLITNYLDDLIRFAILHQSLTTQSEATGIGGGASALHQTTFDQIVKFDATALDDTETEEMLAVMYATNEPGIPCGRVVSQVDSPNAGQMAEAAQAIVGMGGSIPARPLLEAAGIPEPKQGDTLLGGVQANQPAAVGAIPDNMPVENAQAASQPPVG